MAGDRKWTLRTVTLFASRVTDPIHVIRDTDYILTNLSTPTTNTGVERLGLLRSAPFAVTASYTYVRARERGGDVPLTPPFGRYRRHD